MKYTFLSTAASQRPPSGTSRSGTTHAERLKMPSALLCGLLGGVQSGRLRSLMPRATTEMRRYGHPAIPKKTKIFTGWCFHCPVGGSARHHICPPGPVELKFPFSEFGLRRLFGGPAESAPTAHRPLARCGYGLLGDVELMDRPPLVSRN